MKHLAYLALMAPLAGCVMPASSYPPPPVTSTSTTMVVSSAMFTEAQLDLLLGPIALYPDPLIALVLPASTNSSDIVLAARYLNTGGDPAQVEAQPWDDSVRGLARYPQIVQWMDENLAWTKQLGDAVAGQPTDVMNAIQRLRARARDAGTLVSTAQQQVVYQDGMIMILPVSPEIIYVPYYDPNIVYVRNYGRPVDSYVGFSAGFATGWWLSFGIDWWDHSFWNIHHDHREWYWREHHRDWYRHGRPPHRGRPDDRVSPWHPRPGSRPPHAGPGGGPDHRPPNVEKPKPHRPGTPGDRDRHDRDGNRPPAPTTDRPRPVGPTAPGRVPRPQPQPQPAPPLQMAPPVQQTPAAQPAPQPNRPNRFDRGQRNGERDNENRANRNENTSRTARPTATPPPVVGPMTAPAQPQSRPAPATAAGRVPRPAPEVRAAPAPRVERAPDPRPAPAVQRAAPAPRYERPAPAVQHSAPAPRYERPAPAVQHSAPAPRYERPSSPPPSPPPAARPSSPPPESREQSRPQPPPQSSRSEEDKERQR